MISQRHPGLTQALETHRSALPSRHRLIFGDVLPEAAW